MNNETKLLKYKHRKRKEVMAKIYYYLWHAIVFYLWHPDI